MAHGSWAYIQYFDQPGAGHPDQGLPGGGRPSRPIDPGFGWGGGEHPSHGLPGFPGAPGHPGHLPARPSRPTDPDYGVDEGADAGQLPVWPLDPEHPDVGLPPVAGQPLPPTDPPPGTVWPPLDLPGVPEGKAIVLAALISSTGHKTMRYIVVEVPEGGYPDQGLPGEGEEHPDQGLPSPQPPRPGAPPRPGQGLPRPPVAGQPHPGNRPPGSAPPRPGQGLPPTAQPKR